MQDGHEPQAFLISCENRPKKAQKISPLISRVDFTAISGFVDSTFESLANGFYVFTTYGLRHVIKYHTVIYWADGRNTGTYF